MSPLLTKEEFSLFNRETQISLIYLIGTLKATQELEGDCLFHLYWLNNFYVEVLERKSRVLNISLHISRGHWKEYLVHLN